MNLRIQSGLAHSRPTLDAFSISFGPSACRQADKLSANFNRILHRPVGGGTAFPDSLPGHQLNARVGLINLWKQVQKGLKLVDFTSVGA
jgi:hypothetical protein